MAHAYLAPSSAGIWGSPEGCRAYPYLSSLYPERETEDTRAGDAAHEVAATLVREGARGFPMQKFIGSPTSNGYIVTEEIQEAAEMYAVDVLAAVRQYGVFNENLRIEEKVACHSIHPMVEGTPDASLFDRHKGRLIVWDFKFGHRFVDAFENWQMITYTSGLLDKYGIPAPDDAHVTVEHRIVQPRHYCPEGPIRSHVYKASDLRAHFYILVAAAEECLIPDVDARTGKHCRDCPARLNCPAFRLMSASAKEYAARAVPEIMDAEAIGVELALVERYYDVLDQRKDALRQQAEEMLRQGNRVPNWALQPKLGNLAWQISDSDVFTMFDALGVDLRKTKPLTPTQTKTELKKADLDPALVDLYATRPDAGFKLVRDDLSYAKKVFSK